MPKRTKPLNEQERAFVVAFRGKAQGNATRAAIAAGYSRRTAGTQGSRLLKRVHVQQALVALLDARDKKEIADADERDRALTAIIRSKASVQDRIRAIAEMNKCEGRHSLKHVHEGKLTLEQVLAESRG